MRPIGHKVELGSAIIVLALVSYNLLALKPGQLSRRLIKQIGISRFKWKLQSSGDKTFFHIRNTVGLSLDGLLCCNLLKSIFTLLVNILFGESRYAKPAIDRDNFVRLCQAFCFQRDSCTFICLVREPLARQQNLWLGSRHIAVILNLFKNFFFFYFGFECRVIIIVFKIVIYFGKFFFRRRIIELFFLVVDVGRFFICRVFGHAALLATLGGIGDTPTVLSLINDERAFAFTGCQLGIFSSGEKSFTRYRHFCQLIIRRGHGAFFRLSYVRVISLLALSCSESSVLRISRQLFVEGCTNRSGFCRGRQHLRRIKPHRCEFMPTSGYPAE